MRLSEAIRLGAMLSGQARGAFFTERNGETATCALGAAANAVGTTEPVLLRLSKHWPILYSVVPSDELPAEFTASPSPQRLAEVIMTLNDVHRWTRTEIADWVSGFEKRRGGGCAELVPHRSHSPTSVADSDDSQELAVCAR